MNEQFGKLELNTQQHYLSLLAQELGLLSALKAVKTRIEVFESAFNLGGK